MEGSKKLIVKFSFSHVELEETVIEEVEEIIIPKETLRGKGKITKYENQRKVPVEVPNDVIKKLFLALD